jgi:hypothetical protein
MKTEERDIEKKRFHFAKVSQNGEIHLVKRLKNKEKKDSNSLASTV